MLTLGGENCSKKPARKTRARTGCLTCRIRRVKCDEAKPRCVRCTSTGRKCDGYSVVRTPSKPLCLNQKSYETAIIRNPGSSGSLPERLGLYNFRVRAAPALTSYFDSEFWDTLVFQAGDVEPTVRYALIALNYLEESLEQPKESRNRDAKCLRLALEQYNRAISLTAHKIATIDPSCSDAILICCIIFFYIEIIQNNYNTAMGHLTNGLRIMFGHARTAPPYDLFFQPTAASFTRRCLQQNFTRIIIQSIFLGTYYYNGQLMPPDIANSLKPFLNISEARASLDDLFISVYLFLRATREQISNRDYQRPGKYTNLLRKWHSYFLEFIRSHRPIFTPKDSTGATMLQIHYISLSIVLSTTLNPSILAFEALTPSFARIVALTERLLDSPTTKLPSYSFDVGIIPPLYYTALRCRSSLLRHRTIALLYRCPTREGIWSATMTAKIAERLVQIEEESGALPRSLDADGGMKVDEKEKFESEGYWRVKFHKPEVPNERSIKMHIGRNGLRIRDREIDGGREELVRW